MMANLRTGCSFRCNILLATALMVLLQTVLCEAQIVFGPEDPDNNEVIYFGEDVAFTCEVLGLSSDESVEFSILKNGKALIANNTNLATGNITDTQTSKSYIRFVLKSFASENGDYACRATSRRKDYGVKFYKLELQPQDTVQCRRNVSYMYISMEVVRLSCYFTPSGNEIVKWFQNDTNGLIELTSTKVEVNALKHKVCSIIEPADELNLSNYFCQEEQVDSTVVMTESCEVGSLLVYNRPFIFVTPNLLSIPVESSINLTCNVTTLPDTVSLAILEPPSNDTLPVGVITTAYGSKTLGIQVSAEAEVGTVINVKCNAFIGNMQSSIDFPIVIEARETTNSATQTPSSNTTPRNDTDQNNIGNNDITIIIVLVSVVAIVIIVIFIAVVCVCLCRRKQESKSAQEYDNTELSFPTYGKVNRNKNKSGDENETDATLEENGDGEDDYNLVNLPTNQDQSNTDVPKHLAHQSRDVGKGYTDVKVNSPDHDPPVSVLYSTAVKN